MFCTKCGHPNSEGQKFCRSCGTNFLVAESGDLQSGQLETTNLKTGDMGSPAAGSPPIPSERATKRLDAISSELDSSTRPIAASDYHRNEAAGNEIETEQDNAATSSPLDTQPPATGSAPVISSNRSHRGLGISLALAAVLIVAATSFYYFRVAGNSSSEGEATELAESTNTNQSQAATTEESQPPLDPLPSDALGLTPDAPAQRTDETAKGDKTTGRNGKPEGDNSNPPSQNGSNPTDTKSAAASPATPAPPPAPVPTPTAEEYKQQGFKAMEAKQYGQAITAFRAALRLQPSNGDYHYLIGMAYERQGLLAEALNAYKRCQSGTYFPQAVQHVKRLTKKLEKK